MNNTERREALNTARSQAYSWARHAVERAVIENYGSERTVEDMAMATMWAAVAQALKTGDATSDTPEH